MFLLGLFLAIRRRYSLIACLSLVLCTCEYTSRRTDQMPPPPEETNPEWPAGGEWHLESNATTVIGRADGPSQYALGDVRAATVLGDQTIAVLDNMSKQVRIYDALGRYVATWGRAGNGPGEFKSLVSLARLPGDSIIVTDAAAHRLTVFDKTGKYVRSVNPERAGTYGLRILGMLDSRRAVVHAGSVYAFQDGLTRDTTLIGILDIATGSIDLIGRFPGNESIVRRSGGRLAQRIAPYSRATLATARAGVYYIGRSDTDAVEGRSIDGQIVRVPHVRRIMPVPRNGARRYYAATQSGADLEAIIRRFGDDVPPSLPAFDRLILDMSGHLWVRRYSLPWDLTPRTWDIHTPTGTWLGSVVEPTRLEELFEIGSDYVLALRKDQWDAPQVVKYELNRYARGMQGR